MTRFELDRTFAEQYPIQRAGGETILDLRVPAEDLEDFNRHIIGPIEVVGEYHAADASERSHLRRGREEPRRVHHRG